MNTQPYIYDQASGSRFANTSPTPCKSDETLMDQEQDTASQTAKVALLVIEDHASLLDGLIPQLAHEYDVTVVHNMAELEGQLAQKRFTLATVDLTIDRRLEGLNMMPLLSQAGIKFLVFSGTAEEWHIRAAMRLRASGYVDKREKLCSLLDALEIIAAGDFIFPDEMLVNLQGRKDEVFPEMAGAEIEAIDAIFKKLHPTNIRMPSNKDLAQARRVGLRRIENIIRDLVGKFKLRDTSREALLTELLARGYYPGASKDSFQQLGVFKPPSAKNPKKRH